MAQQKAAIPLKDLLRAETRLAKIGREALNAPDLDAITADHLAAASKMDDLETAIAHIQDAGRLDSEDHADGLMRTQLDWKTADQNTRLKALHAWLVAERLAANTGKA